MTLVQMKLKLPHYESVKAGRKTVEGRPGDGSFGKLVAGDIIHFSLDGEPEAPVVPVKITDIRRYASFELMIEAEGKEACLPGLTASDEEAVALYHSFPNYAQRARDFGVVAIVIERL